MSRSASYAHTATAPSAAQSLIPAQGNGRRLQQRLSILQQEVAEIVTEAAETGNHTNGPRVQALEEAFKGYLKVADAIAVNSGSSALRAACELLRLPPGSEIIIPAYTFIMTAYSVNDAFAVDPQSGTFTKGGLTPVFVDIDPQTYTLDPASVREALSERTAAIIAVHMLGQMADMRPLLDLADEYRLFVIEDAAQAHGATYCDPRTNHIYAAGSMGDCGCFSLSDVKNIGSMGSDAGLLTLTTRLGSRLPSLSAEARAWRNTGRLGRHRYEHQTWGIRARMDEYSAAECLAQLRSLDRWVARRQQIAARYSAALAGTSFTAPYIAPGRRHAFFNYMVKAPTLEARHLLESRLRAAGIQVADTYSVVPDQPLYRQGLLPCRIVAAERAREIAQLLVAIPCYPELREEEIARIEEVLSHCP
ncbi:DegT/DnrJ/EryC1/StrS family aminotransferase [Thermogemmatispora sp.]|uniref:DegT/DnrJ/EryC1/StrS family aminotransferase n=1 Tax=Thermogemmatispora sp. TaxID=1968838 RepID=UPI001DD784F0|nr:DegT/DnrJ/EryC1/StrS family aminotransferase [Thermogemmatispora sp.]MBX5450682.1 DegT/DnrJ/EryC1/StrS family aminotransferase [Thermogemmatispora sp.]